MPAATNRTFLLISVDGMRPDGLLKANTPVMDRLIREGAATLEARSVMPSVTLPCHTSMLRGVDVPRHGITSNTFTPLARPVPSLIDVAKNAGRRTGFFFNWPELRDLSEPGSLDVSYCWGRAFAPEDDDRVTTAAIAHLQEQAFDLLFVYLGWTDECGHAHGWMTPDYLEAIANADRCIGRLLEALKSVNRETITLILSDHGGHERSHGTDSPEDMTIPWILHGPGITPARRLAEPIYLYDTCTTLAQLMGLPSAREWDGRMALED